MNKVGIALLAAVALGALSSGAQAAVTTFGANPTGNSGDFNAAAASQGGSVTTNINFDSPAVGASYTTTGGAAVVNGEGPNDGNTFTAPLSSGEGTHPVSNYLQLTGASSLTVDFLNPTSGAGLYTIDLFNPFNVNPVSLSAFSGLGGTGTLLGTVTAEPFNFQPDNLYFLGILSDSANISSIVFNTTGGAGDTVGLDDVVSVQGTAAVPEPATWAMMLFGFGAAGISLRRRKQVMLQAA